MISQNQQIRIEVRFSSKEELEKAREELFLSGAQEVEIFDGSIEALVEADAVQALKSQGFLIDFPFQHDVKFEGKDDLKPGLLSLNEPKHKKEDPELKKVVNKFRQQCRHINIDQKTFRSSISDDPRPETIPLLDGAASLEAERNLSHDHKDLLDEDAYTIKLKGPMKDEWREQLKELGIVLQIFYKPGSPYTYSAFLSKQQLTDLQSLNIVHSVRRYGLEQSLTPELIKKFHNTDFQDDTSDSIQTFDAVLHDESHLKRVQTFIESSGEAKDISHGANIIRFKTSTYSSLIPALANLPFVASVSVYTPPKLFCDVSRNMIGLNFPVGSKSYFGDSEVVAIFDSGIDANHPDLSGNIKEATAYGHGVAEDQLGHGTHVAGIICGKGNASNGQIKGMAPQSRIISIGLVDNSGNLDLPVDLGDLMKLAADRGAKIINLSWGQPMKGDYHHGSFSLDRFAYDHPEILIVVAAGNDGQARYAMHSYKTVGVPGTAKNVLTVGAAASKRNNLSFVETWGQRAASKFPSSPQKDELVVIHDDDIGPAAASSRGPTDFDSIKPEVIAPGTYILAPKANGTNNNAKERYDANDQYTYKTGTSMATPVVSGLAALIREYLRKEHNHQTPSSSLIKGIIIATAHPIKNIREGQDQSLKEVGFPDFDQGYGLVSFEPLWSNSENLLSFADVPNKSPNALVSKAPYGGERKSSRQYEFELEAEGNLSVVLTWLDPPAKGVQNNMQLSLGTPAYKWELGNMNHVYKKSGFFDVTPGVKNVYPQDKYNTVEKISIPDAPEGRYRIKVMAQSTVSLPQGYSLVVIGKLKDQIREYGY